MWFYFLFIVIVVNVFLFFLLLQFIIIPYLIEVGDLPNDTSLDLYKQVLSIITTTPPPLPQDIIYL